MKRIKGIRFGGILLIAGLLWLCMPWRAEAAAAKWTLKITSYNPLTFVEEQYTSSGVFFKGEECRLEIAYPVMYSSMSGYIDDMAGVTVGLTYPSGNVGNLTEVKDYSISNGVAVRSYAFTPPETGTYRVGMNWVNNTQTGQVSGNVASKTFSCVDRYYTISYSAEGAVNVPANQTKTYDVDIQLSSQVPKLTYIVNFDANGGTVSPASSSVERVFDCWTTGSEIQGTLRRYNPGMTITWNSNAILTARWKDIIYSNSLVLPTPLRPRHSFQGWYTEKTGGSKITGSSNLTSIRTTAYAHWKKVKVLISYNANGGSNAPSAQEEDITGSSVYLSYLAPERTCALTYDANGGEYSQNSATKYYTFQKWNTKADGSGTGYSSGAAYTGTDDLLLYATWTAPTVGDLYSPYRDGYSFDGWYTAKNGGTKVTGSTVMSGDMTIYAHWTAVPGSSGSPEGTGTDTGTTAKKDVSQALVTLSRSVYTYSMENFMPAVTVTLGGKTLKVNRDYTIAYSNNTNAGTAAVMITGTGDYTGRKSAAFTIVKADQKFSDINSSYTLAENDSMSLASARVSATLKTSAGNVTVYSEAAKTYKSSDSSVVYVDQNGLMKALKAGSAAVTVTDPGTSNLNAISFTLTVKVEKAGASGGTNGSGKIHIGSCNITLSKNSYTFSGKALKPEVTMTYNGKTLKTDSDYTVSYLNNVNAGQAIVRVTGKGNYSGQKDETFTIRKKAQKITVKNITLVRSAKKQTKKLSVKVLGGAKVTYTPSNKKVKISKGKATIPANFVGLCKIKVKTASTQNYSSGSKTLKVTVNPPATSLTGLSISKGKGAFKISWKAVKNITGYEVQMAQDGKFKKSVEKKKVSSTSAEFYFTTGKTYHFRVRSYKKVSGKLYYSKWSKVQYRKAE